MLSDFSATRAYRIIVGVRVDWTSSSCCDLRLAAMYDRQAEQAAAIASLLSLDQALSRRVHSVSDNGRPLRRYEHFKQQQ